ncbi:MAG TPA: diaminopimelate epimerase [Streptosporangiaceae bacterium]|nr:diaminopimelate epimerase [Streptosporangiaceae bacterium]
MRFAKGHGTENDFVILPDPNGALDLRAGLVARLCDRHAGLGADGVLRVVRTAAAAFPLAGAAGSAAPGERSAGQVADAEWFMDYRNADGSLAEMCGNGIRVFTRYLIEEGLASGDEFAIATRGGLRQVRVHSGGDISVEMGAPHVLGPGHVRLGGRVCHGLRVSVGNPHLACVVDTPLDEFDLSVEPELDPGQFPAGANVELVRVTGRAAVRMRVRERGSGETRSCGTGAVAAAVAAAYAADGASRAAAAGANGAPLATASVASGDAGAHVHSGGHEADGPDGAGGGSVAGGGGWAGQDGASWRVAVPGGELTVTLGGQTSWLAGPAVIVGDGELRDAWLSVARPAS